MKKLLLPLLAGLLLNAVAEEFPPGFSPPKLDSGASQSCRLSYPAMAKRNGEEGSVQLRFYVEATGDISKIETLSSSGHSRLDQAAINYVKCRKYKPGMVDGVPTAMRQEIPINFKFDNTPLSPLSAQ